MTDDLRRFEITTCFLNGPSTLDPAVIAAAVSPLLPHEGWRDSAPVAVRTASVFFGAQFSHTNVDVAVRVPTFADAVKIRDAISEATGRRRNAPTQDYDDVRAELGDARSWSVFTAEGALAVQAVVDKLEGWLRSGELSPVNLETKLTELEQPLYGLAPGYGDTEPGSEVRAYLRKVCRELGVELLDLR